MRRPNRNFEVFSMSALDLFASALGVFIIVAIVLFPYFQKSEAAELELEATQERLEQTETALNEAQARAEAMQTTQEALATAQEELQSLRDTLQQAQSRNAAQEDRLEQAENELEQARVELAKTFLIVGIDWTVSSADVDLYVTDPDGNTFYYAANNRSGYTYVNSDAQLSYDMRSGPGIELWQNPEAKPGEYQVEYELFSVRSGSTVRIEGDIYDRRGRHDLPPITLRRRGERAEVATVTVDQAGHVTLHP